MKFTECGNYLSHLMLHPISKLWIFEVSETNVSVVRKTIILNFVWYTNPALLFWFFKKLKRLSNPNKQISWFRRSILRTLIKQTFEDVDLLVSHRRMISINRKPKLCSLNWIQTDFFRFLIRSKCIMIQIFSPIKTLILLKVFVKFMMLVEEDLGLLQHPRWSTLW